MAYDISITTLPRRHTAVVRIKAAPADLSQRLPAAYGEIGAYLQETGVDMSATQVFAWYTGMGEVFDVEAGFTVEAPVEGRGRVQPGALPACEAARTLHVGPYEALPAANAAMQAWMAANGRTPAAGPWEVYLNDPQTAPPSEWQTELIWPIRLL